MGQTLTHRVRRDLQEHPPTPSTVVPRLRSALTSRVIVEQAKGFLREMLGVSVEEAFNLLPTYSRDSGERLIDVAALITDRCFSPAAGGGLGRACGAAL